MSRSYPPDDILDGLPVDLTAVVDGFGQRPARRDDFTPGDPPPDHAIGYDGTPGPDDLDGGADVEDHDDLVVAAIDPPPDDGDDYDGDDDDDDDEDDDDDDDDGSDDDGGGPIDPPHGASEDHWSVPLEHANPDARATFLFDAMRYLQENPDLAGEVSLGEALQHYLAHGAAEDRRPNGWFDDDFYRGHNRDVADLDDATLFMHFNAHGVWEGRAPNAQFERFDGGRYLSENPDVAAYVHANLDDFLGSVSNGAIAHFILYGAEESRTAFETTGTPIAGDLFV